MKKVLAIALALVFMFALAIPAFATVEISDNKDFDEVLETKSNSANQTEIRYDVEGNYIVTVPALIELTSVSGSDHTPDVIATGTATVTTDDVIIPYGKELVISMAGNGTDNAFQIATNGHTIAYTVKAGSETIVPSTTIVEDTVENATKDILVLQDGGSRTTNGYIHDTSVELAFTAGELARYQGAYIGYITFTVGLRTAAQ